MKPLYRIIITFLLTVSIALVAHAQFEDDGIISGVEIDTCAYSKSFSDGWSNYIKGKDYYSQGLYYTSEEYLDKAIRCFEQHLNECPGNVKTMHLLGYSYYWLFYASNTATNKDYLEKALLYLPEDDTQSRFLLHFGYGNSLLWEDSLSGIEPDYCRAFREFDKAIENDFDFKLYPELISLFKDVLYQHATLLFHSYLNNLPDTTNLCGDTKEIPVWDTCIGDQQLDRCIDDLNRLVGIGQNESDNYQIDSSALVLLGECYYYKGEYEQAKAYYKKSGNPNLYDEIVFLNHYNRGVSLYYGDTLNCVEPDYCGAFQEFEKAIDCDINYHDYPKHVSLYKNSLYLHAYLLFLSYLNNLPDTTNLCGNTKEIPAWDTCIGDQQLDHCIDDLNRLVGIKQDESDNYQIDPSALVLLGECYYYKGEYEQATECYEKSSIPPDQLDVLAAICYLNSYDTLGIIGEKVDILNDLIIEAYRNDYTFYRLLYRDVADVKIFKNDVNDKEIKDSWLKSAHQFLLHYIGRSEFEKGIDFWLKIKNNFSFSPILLMDQALCHIYVGDFSAISDFAYAYNLMNEKVSDTLNKPSNDEAAAFKEIKDAYCASAIYCFYLEKNYEEAMDHYANDSTIDGQLMRAICSQQLAEKESDSLRKAILEENAMYDFYEIIRKEDSIGKYSNTPYAYLFLKEPDKAINILERMLKTDFPDSINTKEDSLDCHSLHYEAAEIYAQVGDLCKARQHIDKAFVYCNDPIMLALAIKMPLLEPIRDYVEQEVNRYKEKLGISEHKIHREPLVCDIPFKKNNDYTRTINCWINDSIVELLFDPGADKCQLNIEDAEKIGITCNDIIGYTSYNLANGKDGVNPLVSLKKVKIGNIELENVQAVIDSTAKAKSLLGCTVLNNLKVEMPSPVNKGMIRLTYIKESIEIPEDKKNTDKKQGE